MICSFQIAHVTRSLYLSPSFLCFDNRLIGMKLYLWIFDPTYNVQIDKHPWSFVHQILFSMLSIHIRLCFCCYFCRGWCCFWWNSHSFHVENSLYQINKITFIVCWDNGNIVIIYFTRFWIAWKCNTILSIVPIE